MTTAPSPRTSAERPQISASPAPLALQVQAMRQRLHGLGANPQHAHRVLRLWSHGLSQDTGRRRLQDFMPLRVRQALPGLCDEWSRLARLQASFPGADGSARLLVALHDDQQVETVLLPRGGVCVSTQLGCAVGCRFCLTGRDGLVRQLGSAEIVAQVALARTLQPVRKVVFMGMGEPAHNLEQVIEAITLLGTEGGIAHKQLVFSTVGDERVFERLPLGPVKPALAVSLHSTRDDRRRWLLPRAPHIDPRTLVERAEGYARTTGHPIQYQWTLLAGVNDGDDELDGIVALLHGKFAMLNLIAYNTVPGSPFARTAPARATAMARQLLACGILTKVRQSAAQDVEAGCGQLRARGTTAAGARVVALHPAG